MSDYMDELMSHLKDVNDPKNQQMAQAVGTYLQGELDRDEYLSQFKFDVDTGDGGPVGSWAFQVHSWNNQLFTKNKEHVEVGITLRYVYKVPTISERRFEASVFIIPYGGDKRLRAHKLGWGGQGILKNMTDLLASLKVLLKNVEGIIPGFDSDGTNPPAPEPESPSGKGLPVPVKEDQLVMAWVQKNCKFAQRTIPYSALPDDLQILIGDYTPDENWDKLQQHVFAIKEIPITAFPDVPIGEISGDSRDEQYAKDMIGQKLPPIVMFGNAWLDGKHRVWAAKQSGQQMIDTIDLADLKIQGMIIAGRLGTI
jgi:hypothetical protein